MNFGECPYDGCKGTFFLEVPDKTPAYNLVECEKCGGTVWYRFSRINPKAYTKEQFLEIYDVNPEKHTIKLKIQTHGG